MELSMEVFARTRGHRLCLDRIKTLAPTRPLMPYTIFKRLSAVVGQGGKKKRGMYSRKDERVDERKECV